MSDDQYGTLPVTCCDATVTPVWFTHDDGTVKGQWRCEQCGLCLGAREESFRPAFSKIAAAGLQTVPLYVILHGVVGR